MRNSRSDGEGSTDPVTAEVDDDDDDDDDVVGCGSGSLAFSFAVVARVLITGVTNMSGTVQPSKRHTSCLHAAIISLRKAAGLFLSDFFFSAGCFLAARLVFGVPSAFFFLEAEVDRFLAGVTLRFRLVPDIPRGHLGECRRKRTEKWCFS